jgi:ArsR family metal-binding transcriptional regulator
VTRAVINFTGDITNAMSIWAKAIPTAAYNKAMPILAFRYKDWRVIINPEEITIKDLANEANAREVMEYLKNIINPSTSSG